MNLEPNGNRKMIVKLKLFTTTNVTKLECLDYSNALRIILSHVELSRYAFRMEKFLVRIELINFSEILF